MTEEFRLDGWENVILGLGEEGVDKTLETKLNKLTRTSELELRNLFHNDSIVHKVITALPSDALSKGFTIKGVEKPELFEKELKRLKAIQKVRLALMWERLFGGSVIYKGIKDGQTDIDSQSKPAKEKIEKIHWLKVIDRRYIVPDRTSIVDDVVDEEYDQAQLYEVLSRIPSPDGIYKYERKGKIHKSRLMLFKGEDTTDDVREALQGWGMSVVDLMITKLRRNATMWLSGGYMMSESSYNIMKINNLAQLIAAGKESQVKVRIKLANYAKSVARTWLVGQEEDIQLKERTFSGVPEMLRMYMIELSEAADMPVTRLWGRTAEGMNATGEGDANNWLSKVESYRTDKVEPHFTDLLHSIGVYLNQDTSKLEIEWPELEPLNDKERAEVWDKRASGAQKLIDAQVFYPEEIALALHEELGIKIEVSERKEALEARDYEETQTENTTGSASNRNEISKEVDESGKQD